MSVVVNCRDQPATAWIRDNGDGTGSVHIIGSSVSVSYLNVTLKRKKKMSDLSGLRNLEAKHGHFDGVNADEYVAEIRGNS